jgi:hypothetical protein
MLHDKHVKPTRKQRVIQIQVRDQTREIPAKWVGIALAVHRPSVERGLSNVSCQWSITHIESGLTAGIYSGTLKDAIKLAKAWDHIFAYELKGEKPDASSWPRRFEWTAQLKQHKPILPPDTFEAIVNEYGQQRLSR